MDNLEKKNEITVDAELFRTAVELARFVTRLDTQEVSLGRRELEVLLHQFMLAQCSVLLPDWLRRKL